MNDCSCITLSITYKETKIYLRGYEIFFKAVKKSLKISALWTSVLRKMKRTTEIYRINRIYSRNTMAKILSLFKISSGFE